MKTKVLLTALALGMALSSPALAAEKIKIVTTTSTLASLAADIAGEKADIHFIASPNRDIHFITPTPRDVLKTRKADVFVHGGLDLELWRDPLLNAVGRKEFFGEDGRAIDASHDVRLLEIPADLSRLHGDMHASGNPHYSLDPENAKVMARNIAAGLTRLYPEHAHFFETSLQVFLRRIERRMTDWQIRMEPFKGLRVVTYHKSWIYFLERFGLEDMAQLEPKPGIRPTPRHLQEITKLIREHGIRAVIQESFYETSSAEKAVRNTGAKIARLAVEPAEVKGDYEAMIEHNIALLEEALK